MSLAGSQRLIRHQDNVTLVCHSWSLMGSISDRHGLVRRKNAAEDEVPKAFAEVAVGADADVPSHAFVAKRVRADPAGLRFVSGHRLVANLKLR